jgi:REP element-mobilizing transposase RayT
MPTAPWKSGASAPRQGPDYEQGHQLSKNPPHDLVGLVYSSQTKTAGECNGYVGRTLLSVAVDFAFDLDLGSDPRMHNRALERKYEYHRNLPHYQKAGRAVFITFCKGNRIPFAPEAQDAILQHCLHDNGKRYDLHAAVVMPDHVHLLLTPLRDEKGWPYSLPTILKQLKGTTARTINKCSTPAAQSGRKNPSTTYSAHKKASKKNWNTFGRIQSDEDW